MLAIDVARLPVGLLARLAGVTDPEVAFFPGGHTSKRIPRAWLFARQPSAIVLLLARGASLEPEWSDTLFARAVEQRVARLVASEFRVRGVSRHLETLMWLLPQFLPVDFKVVRQGAGSQVTVVPGA